MKLSRKYWVLLVTGIAIIITGAILAVPRIQNYLYVRSIKKESVNLLMVSGGIFTIHLITKDQAGVIYPNAYFRIDWKNSTNNTSGTHDMKSDNHGVASAVLPAGTVEAGWSPGSEAFYLPYSVCPSGTPGNSVCDVATSPTIVVMEDAPIGK